MKTTIHCLLILSFLIGSSSIFAQNALKDKELKGNVKTVSATTYRTAMEDEKVKLLTVSALETHNFNEAGYTTSTELQRIRETEEKGPKQKKVYELNKDNNILKETGYKDDVESNASVFNYEEKQLVTKEFKRAGKSLGVQSFSYDANGNKILSNAVDTEGNPRQKVEFTYTKDNKILSIKNYKKDKLVAHVKYEYPSETEEKMIFLDVKEEGTPVKSYTIKTTDKDDKLLSSIDYTAEGEVKRKRLYEYDEQGNQTINRSVDADGVEGSRSIYEYEYDEQGNWIQKTEYFKDEYSTVAMEAIKRVIEYYK